MCSKVISLVEIEPSLGPTSPFSASRKYIKIFSKIPNNVVIDYHLDNHMIFWCFFRDLHTLYYSSCNSLKWDFTLLNLIKWEILSLIQLSSKVDDILIDACDAFGHSPPKEPKSTAQVLWRGWPATTTTLNREAPHTWELESLRRLGGWCPLDLHG